VSSETDLTGDLARLDKPTMILQGGGDQLLPIATSALLSAKLIKHSTLGSTKARRTGCSRLSTTA